MLVGNANRAWVCQISLYYIQWKIFRLKLHILQCFRGICAFYHFFMVWKNTLLVGNIVCVKLARWSLCDREDISITHLIIIIKSEISTFLTFVIHLHGYVPEMVVPSYAVGFVNFCMTAWARFCHCFGIFEPTLGPYLVHTELFRFRNN